MCFLYFSVLVTSQVCKHEKKQLFFVFQLPRKVKTNTTVCICLLPKDTNKPWKKLKKTKHGIDTKRYLLRMLFFDFWFLGLLVGGSSSLETATLLQRNVRRPICAEAISVPDSDIAKNIGKYCKFTIETKVGGYCGVTIYMYIHICIYGSSLNEYSRSSMAFLIESQYSIAP